ncbi:hypothetical protein SAMN05216241_10380 [Limimonas halophila]|uniref:Helix-turn-helix domain-containing protein n=1 Tax=Limimonas halophila TaxID=1082479 RepID=A0A1G7PWN5_9PROT|nr:hypothetical protein [Limimonas halophila]SDF90029.1 hypothetical protein SAMN05216241_10380 [Limimonas halophila]
MVDELPGTRAVAAETARIAKVVAGFRAMHGLARREVAAALRVSRERIALYEFGAAGVSTTYAGGLVQMCGADPAHLLTILFRPDGWPAEVVPLPDPPTVMETALRLWRQEPASERQARTLLAHRLAAAPPPRRSALMVMRDPFRALPRRTANRP